jgi:hypothetical protein
MGKKFVIMEVEKIKEVYSKEVVKYTPVENASSFEYMWLKPDRVIDGDRLRYGLTKTGETYFAGGWVKWPGANPTKHDRPERERLILDPPKKEEENELEKLRDEVEKLRDEVNKLMGRVTALSVRLDRRLLEVPR